MEHNTFEVRYNVTGDERKRLVRAMGDILEAEPKYLGAPSFAYEIGYFTVDKIGTVAFDSRADSEEIEKLIERLHELGFEAEKVSSDTNDGDELVIEMPLTDFTPEKLDNLVKLVAAKESLLKAALGAEDLPIQQTENTLRFPWFKGCLDSDSVHAYTTLISKLCETAKEKQRVSTKKREVDNPKYAMRCWLLSLGFIGDEYKVSRKILLKNLHGSSAFKTPKGGTDDEQ
ncbi:MAG: Virulence-related protein [Desulfotomaculum sp. 46_80]|nr:MAG: Virulence-related protein [Desulfotomaculum sp. 46_80]